MEFRPISHPLGASTRLQPTAPCKTSCGDPSVTLGVFCYASDTCQH